MNKDTIWIAICLIACLPLIYLTVIACLSNGKRGAQPTIPPYPYPPRSTTLPGRRVDGFHPKYEGSGLPPLSAPTEPIGKPLDHLIAAYVQAREAIEKGEVSQDDFRALMNAYGEYINAEVGRGR